MTDRLRHPSEGGPLPARDEAPSASRQLDESACWEVLGARGVGRLALRAEPVGVDIVPIDYLVLDRVLYFRSGPGTKLVELAAHPHVAVEVDHRAADLRVSVVVKGRARRLDADDEIERSGVLALRASEPGEKFNYVSVTVETITGRAFRDAAGEDLHPCAGAS